MKPSVFRSKLAAAEASGLKTKIFKPGNKVLYLGAGQGTTARWISKLVGGNGWVVCVDFAPSVFDKLLKACGDRDNLLPVLADARKPSSFKKFVSSKVDVVYQDVAQPDQARILVLNSRVFLKKNGLAVLAVKAKSVSQSLPAWRVYEQQLGLLLSSGFELLEFVSLDPFEKDHALVVSRKRF